MEKHCCDVGRGSILFILSLVLMVIPLSGCPSTSSSSSSGGNTTTCASSSSDFYVVEKGTNSGDGKLTRINPTALCKEEILTGLDSPTDFVLASGGSVGYLSDTGVKKIYRVDMSTRGTTAYPSSAFVSPAGLGLLEGANGDSLGCANQTSTILFVADEGSADGGTVWKLCVDTSDFSNSSYPIAEYSLSSDRMENPHGVAIYGGNTMVITAHGSGDSDGRVVTKTINTSDVATVLNTSFTTGIKDLMIEGDHAFVVDATEGSIYQVTLSSGYRSLVQYNLTDPRDILDVSTTVAAYNMTESSAGRVVQSQLTTGDTTSVTTGLTLDRPEGLAK